MVMEEGWSQVDVVREINICSTTVGVFFGEVQGVAVEVEHHVTGEILYFAVGVG